MEYEYNAPFVSERASEQTIDPSERQIKFLMSEVEIERWEAEKLLKDYKHEALRECIQELRRSTSKGSKRLLFQWLLDRDGKWSKAGIPLRVWEERNPAVIATNEVLAKMGRKDNGEKPIKRSAKTEAQKNVVKLKKMLAGALDPKAEA